MVYFKNYVILYLEKPVYQYISLCFTIHSYETRSSMVFHIPKAKTSRFGLNTLRYEGANLWNKFYHALLYKKTNWTKAKLRKLLRTSA